MVINVQTKENMKKTYIIPEVEIVNIQHSNQLLAGSTYSRDDDFGGASGTSDANGIGIADGREDENFDW